MRHTIEAVNRRHWLQAAAAGAVAMAAAGCPVSRGERNRVLKVFNWSDYIFPEAVTEFERLAECRVVYDNYSSDSELEARLAMGGGAYDVVFPSDRTLPALLAKELLQPIDRARLANFANLDPQFLDKPLDPGNRFSVPYFWGTVAVGVRSDKVHGDVSGFEVLFDERYSGRITMLDDPENAIGIVLMHLGLPLNSVEPRDLRRAGELLARQRPWVQAYTSDAYKERLISGDAWVSLGWSGDLMQAVSEREEVRVVVPPSGTLRWLDSMAIPRAATNAGLAHEFIDFLLEADVARRNAEHVCYATPNRAAFNKLPPEVRADESTYPPPATIANCQWLENRGEDIALIEAVWRAVKA